LIGRLLNGIVGKGRQRLMNRGSDDGFHLLWMTPCKQCPSDPTEQSFAPTAFRAKLSLTFLTIHVLEYEASVTVKSLAYVLCRPGSRDILSPIRQSGEMNKSIPPGWNQPV